MSLIEQAKAKRKIDKEIAGVKSLVNSLMPTLSPSMRQSVLTSVRNLHRDVQEKAVAKPEKAGIMQ